MLTLMKAYFKTYLLPVLLFALVTAPLLASPQSAEARSWPIVQQGNTGRNVYTVQYLLREWGYTLSVDGVFGSGTASVVQSFQSSKGLSADGIVGAGTWEKLVITVRQGDSGNDVRALQDQLRNRWGYTNVTVDGVFGSGTNSAVKSFQTSKGLFADGIVGPNTWAALVGGTGDSTSVYLSDAEARALLSAAGIPVTSSGNCSDRNNPTCTSLEQVRRNTINGIIAFKNASGCAVTVTGGTETGHGSGTYSHWNGYKVDISRTTCVTNYIRAHYTSIGNRGDGAPQYRDAGGNIYADEYWANHWDILYY